MVSSSLKLSKLFKQQGSEQSLSIHSPMTSRRFLFLLILIMFITPMISVFTHYSSMVGSVLAEHSTVLTDSIDNASHDACHQHNKAKLLCTTSSACSFSVCGDGDISTVFLLLSLAYGSYRYRQKTNTFPRSFAVAPEIKPPIYSF